MKALLGWLILWLFKKLWPEPKKKEQVMGWLTIISIILTLLGPFLKRWIERRFKEVADTRTNPPSKEELDKFLVEVAEGLPPLRRLAVLRLRDRLKPHYSEIMACAGDPTKTLPIINLANLEIPED